MVVAACACEAVDFMLRCLQDNTALAAGIFCLLVDKVIEVQSLRNCREASRARPWDLDVAVDCRCCVTKESFSGTPYTAIWRERRGRIIIIIPSYGLTATSAVWLCRVFSAWHSLVL